MPDKNSYQFANLLVVKQKVYCNPPVHFTALVTSSITTTLLLPAMGTGVVTALWVHYAC